MSVMVSDLVSSIFLVRRFSMALFMAYISSRSSSLKMWLFCSSKSLTVSRIMPGTVFWIPDSIMSGTVFLMAASIMPGTVFLITDSIMFGTVA